MTFQISSALKYHPQSRLWQRFHLLAVECGEDLLVDACSVLSAEGMDAIRYIIEFAPGGVAREVSLATDTRRY